MRRWIAGLVLAAVLGACPGARAGDDVETAGDVLRVAIPLAALGVAWQQDDRQGLRQFLMAYGATVAGTVALKAAVGDERPDGTGDDAFPSGHAATAFAGAAVLQRRYGWRWAWPAWLLAAGTGWSRVDADEHDWADVAGGAALATAAAWIFVRPRGTVSVAPVALPGGGLGVAVSGRW